MPPVPINLATEDELSECVARRILAHEPGRFQVGYAYRRGGFGYLKRNVQGWNNAAPSIPFLVLTDLDTSYAYPCLLITDWLSSARQHPNLLFRVAVREVEAWLLADHTAFAAYLGIAARQIPSEPDLLADPKAALVELARCTRRRDLRARLAPKSGSTARQGPDYNGCLCEFVNAAWEPERASGRSSSLRRTLDRLHHFKPQWGLQELI